RRVRCGEWLNRGEQCHQAGQDQFCRSHYQRASPSVRGQKESRVAIGSGAIFLPQCGDLTTICVQSPGRKAINRPIFVLATPPGHSDDCASDWIKIGYQGI
ncbi:MAG TPA: hypothetical protein VNZ23_01835, partial [Xanthobacteraceae bacterium]|nr:hypothetical protein [Xanthobacteraceae bacterium]